MSTHFFIFSQRLKEYIVRHEGDDELFVEENEDKLSPRSQDTVLKYVLEFIKNQYTLSIRPDDMIQVCKAVIALFPSLKVEDSEIGGIVSFVRSKTMLVNYSFEIHL